MRQENACGSRRAAARALAADSWRMWRFVKCCVSQPPSWSKPSRVSIGVGLARAEVRLVAVDLDRDLQVGIGEVEAEPPRRHDDLELAHGFRKTRSADQLQHLRLEIALGRGDPAALLEHGTRSGCTPRRPCRPTSSMYAQSAPGLVRPRNSARSTHFSSRSGRHDRPEVEQRAADRGDRDALDVSGVDVRDRRRCGARCDRRVPVVAVRRDGQLDDLARPQARGPSSIAAVRCDAPRRSRGTTASTRWYQVTGAPSMRNTLWSHSIRRPLRDSRFRLLVASRPQLERLAARDESVLEVGQRGDPAIHIVSFHAISVYTRGGTFPEPLLAE